MHVFFFIEGEGSKNREIICFDAKNEKKRCVGA